VRDSAESFDPAYGRVRRAGHKRRQYFDDEATSAKRDRYRPRLATEDAGDPPSAARDRTRSGS